MGGIQNNSINRPLRVVLGKWANDYCLLFKEKSERTSINPVRGEKNQNVQ